MKNQTSFVKGHEVSKEIRDKIRDMQTGKPSHSLGCHHSEQARLDNRLAHLGKKATEDTKTKMSISQIKRMSNPEEIRKCLKRKEKSSLEIKFEQIIAKLGLPYKFVGNGEVLVARKCPDFVDKNGKKIAIEVFYRKHKDMFRDGLEVWKADRAKIFTENGWKIIFFDETQVNENTVKAVLGV